MMLLDTHYHLDFLTEPELRVAFLTALADRGVQVAAQTLLPSAFMDLVGQAATWPQRGVAIPPLSLGFHPWHIGATRNVSEELAIFADAITRTRFVGEIGLDFSPRRLACAPATMQSQVLQHVLYTIYDAAKHTSSDQPYVLSIHAVQSAGTVLDILSEFDMPAQNVIPIFHRFSGTSDDLTRLIRLGGYLSVHPKMLTSKRGKAYVKQVPPERLLLESDLPDETPGTAVSAEAAVNVLVDTLTETLRSLVLLRNIDVERRIRQTQALLYGVS